MDNTLDKTTLSTISLLESRLIRIEHLLYGTTTASSLASQQHDSALAKMNALERRLNKMLTEMRVYGELLKIYKSNPDLFHAPLPSQPPSDLDPSAIQSIVLASAPSFPATLSALTAVKDIPIPDPSASATLITQTKRIRAIETTQLAQMAEIAALRRKSEVLVRGWYERGAVVNSQLLADAEGRLQRAEREVRRREKKVEEGEAAI